MHDCVKPLVCKMGGGGGSGSDETECLVTIHRFQNQTSQIRRFIILVTIHCSAPVSLACAGRSTMNQKMERRTTRVVDDDKINTSNHLK
jgi:hypothetical protein